MRTRALLTRMDVPLGRAVGNAVEVEESVQPCRATAPADLMEVVLALARRCSRWRAGSAADCDPRCSPTAGR